MTASDVTVKLVLSTFTIDLTLFTIYSVALHWQGQRIDLRELLVGGVVLILSFYGVALFGRSVCTALNLVPTGAGAGPFASPADLGLPRKKRPGGRSWSHLLGLRMYVSAALIVWIFSAIGFVQSWEVSLLVAVVGFGLGHIIAVKLAAMFGVDQEQASGINSSPDDKMADQE